MPTINPHDLHGYKILSASDAKSLPLEPFEKLDNAVTIEFWAKPELDPAHSHTFFLAYDKSGKKGVALNITLPWANIIHWDTGPEFAGKDRVQKGITAADLPQSTWQHWAFTADAVTGAKCIYRNGELFAQGTGARTLQPVSEVTLGSNWSGEVAAFRVWSESRSQDQIQASMYEHIESAPGLEFVDFRPEGLANEPGDLTMTINPAGLQNKETIVLTNARPGPIDVSGLDVLILTGSHKGENRYTFPADTTISPGESLTLHTGKVAGAAHCFNSTVQVLYGSGRDRVVLVKIIKEEQA